MSELISGKEAKMAWADGHIVQIRPKTPSETWEDLSSKHSLDIFDQVISYEFRLKPRTINLNGVEVGMIYKSEWESSHPTRVILEFKTTKDALHFSSNISRIFKAV